MKSKSTMAALGAGFFVLAIAGPASSADDVKTVPDIQAKTTTSTLGEKPTASPGWMVLERDFWFPWRLEPINWFHNAEMQYRQKEEKAAAVEIRKAESWLKFAASHALPTTKKSLEDAGADLKVLADDLDEGKVAAAGRMEMTFAKASQALAEWHYFQAKDNSLAKREEGDAAKHLKTAARYLKNAADSAELEYGDDMITVYDDIFGWVTIEVTSNQLEENLDTVAQELERMSASLKKASETE